MPALLEMDAKVRRWMELASQIRRGEPPEFPEVVALRALDFVREMEELARETGEAEQLVLSLALQAVVRGGSLGEPEEAERLAEEIAELAEGGDGWQVHAAVEQLAWFLHGEAAIDLPKLFGGP
jgi:hypothetical protein